jgi:predicted nucleotidyltransferase
MPESQDELVLADLKSIFAPLDLPIMLVGAGARILTFDRFYKPGRFTEDLDIATQIPDWLTFETVTQAMTKAESALFQATKIPHRFQHLATGKIIDVVPFGPISEPDQRLRWPDGNEMYVAGFQEALSQAIVFDDVAIPVVSLPGFIVLKLFAWNDRGKDKGSKSKDQQDIEFVLRYYEDEEGVYSGDSPGLMTRLANGEVQFLHAAIYLLGKDIRAIFCAQTLEQLTPIFEALLKNVDPDDLTDAEQRLITLRQSIESDT